MPARSDTGNTVARRNAYVGEQVENTGPSAAPVAIARRSGDSISCAVSRDAFARENFAFSTIHAHACGNI